jgi:hypothetical protein
LKIDARPAWSAIAIAVVLRATKGVVRRPKTASLISLASIFLPKSSGVRPTISPPRNIASRT